MRRSELAHERQKTNLAEPLASKSWLRRTAKNLVNFAKNGFFQHNRRIAVARCADRKGQQRGEAVWKLPQVFGIML